MYIDLVMGLNFGVDFLLLLGADRLAGYPYRFGRPAAAAAVGGVYGGLCLLPSFHFLGSVLWRIIFLAIMVAIAYGMNQSAIRRGGFFLLLSMTLGGVAVAVAENGWMLLLCAAGVTILSTAAFRNDTDRQYVTVELKLGDKQRKMTALLDTGNTLKDPITGKDVLVVGSDIAREMVGLTVNELSNPIWTMTHSGIKGLRMIPYRSVGCANGMLLAMRMDDVKIGGKTVDMVVAFAPQPIKEGNFEALAGGVV